MSVVDRAFDHPLMLEERASMPLAGGIVQHGFQCGQIWGATLAAGAQAYRLFGTGPQAETAAIIAAQKLVDSFRAYYNSIDCLDIADADLRIKKQMLRYLVKGGAVRCFSLAARFAHVAFSDINTALSDKHIEAPPPPVSCAAALAQKMGASDMHTVMAAGFAGGIGLSGDACGALGAAIWIMEINSGTEDVGKIEYMSRRATEAIAKFVKSTNSKFECSEIVGRRFEDIGDHAGYLRSGGCSEIIQGLATHG